MLNNNDYDCAVAEAEKANAKAAKEDEQARIEKMAQDQADAEKAVIEAEKAAKAKDKADKAPMRGDALAEARAVSQLSAAGFSGSQIEALRANFKAK